MSETLLDIVQAAANEALVPVPSSAINSTDEIAQGLLAMANAAGRDLVRRAEWGALMTLAAIPTVAGQGDYALPADFFRMVGDTAWDTSTNWPVGGPITPQMEQYLRDSTAGLTNIYRQFRQIGRNTIRITPVPPDATGVVAFLYQSRNWCVGTGGKTASGFAADTDTTVFDFDLMVKSTKWRWMAAKGQDAVEFRAEYEDALSSLIAADQGGGTLNMGPPGGDMGGWVIAGTTPNFRISDGSGNNLITDGSAGQTVNPPVVAQDTETFVIGAVWQWQVAVQNASGGVLDLTPYTVTATFYNPGSLSGTATLTTANGGIVVANPTSGMVLVQVPSSLTRGVAPQANPTVPTVKVSLFITDASGNSTLVGILNVVAIAASQT